jgi:hypothetical protein
MVTFDPDRSDRRGFPRGLHEGHDEIFTNERAEQRDLVRQHGSESFLERLAFYLFADAVEPLERASLTVLRNDIAEPLEL